MAQWSAYKSVFRLRAATIEALAKLLDDGRNLRMAIPRANSKDTGEEWENQFADWMKRTADYLWKRCPHSACSRFLHGTESVSPTTQAWVRPDLQLYAGTLDQYLKNLVEIMDHPESYL